MIVRHTCSALVILILTQPLWSEKKIETAYKILQGRYDRDYIISIEMNRGKFKDAKALADWIRYGDQN